jgi:hypothetical protein
MYYIYLDAEQRRENARWHLEFKKKFQTDQRFLECYKMYVETGYLPTYCSDKK